MSGTTALLAHWSGSCPAWMASVAKWGKCSPTSLSSLLIPLISARVLFRSGAADMITIFKLHLPTRILHTHKRYLASSGQLSAAVGFICSLHVDTNSRTPPTSLSITLGVHHLDSCRSTRYPVLTQMTQVYTLSRRHLCVA